MHNLTSAFPRSLLLAVVVTASLVFSGSTSFAADDTTVAREHAQKGKAFMDLAKYPEAASEYEAAYAAKPDPALLLNLAQAYRLAGNTDKALFFYRKYLQHVPKSPYRADIEEKIAALEKQAHVGVGVAPPPATGGGTTATQTPPYTPPAGNPPPPPGNPPGYNPPAGNPPPPPGTYGAGATNYPEANPAGSPNLVPPPPGEPPPAAPPGTAPGSDHGQKLKLAGLVTAGAGVLSIVVGAVFGAQAKDAAKKIETAAANGDVYGPGLQMEDSRGRSALAKEVTFLVIGVAALAAGGAIYHLGTRRSAEAAGTVAILPTASPSELGASVKVSF